MCRNLTQREKQTHLLAIGSSSGLRRYNLQYRWFKGPGSNLQSLSPLKCKTRVNPSWSGTRGLQFHPAWFLLALQFLNGLPWGLAGRILHYQSGFATGSIINMASAPWQLSSHPTRVQKAELKVNKTTSQVAERWMGRRLEIVIWRHRLLTRSVVLPAWPELSGVKQAAHRLLQSASFTHLISVTVPDISLCTRGGSGQVWNIRTFTFLIISMEHHEAGS